MNRRNFIHRSMLAAGAVGSGLVTPPLLAQVPGLRPPAPEGVTVLNPRGRVPVGLIIDDSTCLVNLNRFAMPQFDEAHGGQNRAYWRPWRDWPVEIPDAFVRRFAEWCAEHGVKGKYSVVPYPACVGRLDRLVPGWSRRELAASLDLVRSEVAPDWDIHPEMVTHTRVIDLRTGQPYPDSSLRFMENWDWTTGRSVDELGAYLEYALTILKNVGLPCEGITTPGGFGNRVLPELAQAALQSVRGVFKAEVPHYFRHVYDAGRASVAPRVECAAGLEGPDPTCVVSVIGCTGDWTGGWDCTEPEGADRFITADLNSGRMVEVIERGEPAMMVCHWTGIYWNGQELGFNVFKEVVRRLQSRFDNLIWMKLSELARYWAARELTHIRREANTLHFAAPFACPGFTIRCSWQGEGEARVVAEEPMRLAAVASAQRLVSGTYWREGDEVSACFDLPKGASRLVLGA
jgi:hypothetical protein